MVEVLKNYIGGEWVESRGKETLDVVNPATLEVLAKVPKSTKEDVEDVIKAAKSAFWEWRTTPPANRISYLFEYRDLLNEHFEEISQIIVKEHGKTLDEARGDLKRGIETVEVATSAPTTLMGGNEWDIAKGIDESYYREPLGICVGLTPYNFPAMIPLWFLPMAVACGNTFILKPSSQVPVTAQKLIQYADEAGFPPGVVNMINGSRDVSDVLLKSHDVRSVSFVGSSKVARHIYKTAAETGMRAQCQGQAKNFIVIMPDADMKNTVSACMTSACGCSGQRCLAGENYLPVGKMYEPFKKAILEAASKIKLGYGLDADTQMGPLASEGQYETVLDYIQKGVDEGATLLLDGRKARCDKYPKGFFIGPTVFDNVKPDMTIFKEEIFGPVISITKVDTLEEAIKLANTSIYGNAAAIFTGSGKAARDFLYGVDAGNVGINIGVPAPIAFFPFGGYKESFFGDLHAQGMDAVEFYTQKKIAITRWF